MKHSREELRLLLRRQRVLISAAAQSAASAGIIESVVETSSHLRARSDPGVVAGYVSTGGEIDAMPVLDALRSAGWQTVLPVCGADGQMDFCPWEPGDSLTENRYGIGEPSSSPVAPERIDVVLVPGVGFGRDGSRIGHGVGYYDRYFAKCFATNHDPIRLGVAHDLQIVDLPTPESWDVAMHAVITPSETILIDGQ